MSAFKRLAKRPALAALLLSLCVPHAFAQQNPGGLRGRVADQLGGVLVGVTVTMSDAGGVEKTAVTDGQGDYEFAGLPPGRYTLRVRAKSFVLFENVDINIVAGRRESFDVVMKVELDAEEISVLDGGEGLSTDPASAAGGRVLRDADLDALPDDPDQLEADLRNLAATTGGPDGVTFHVDGFSGGRIPSKASIREVRINANPFAAEQDSFGFNRVEILTKPGTEKFHGQTLMNFNDESLNARSAFAPTRAPLQTRLFGVSLSGPVIPKRAAFFLDFERRDIDENAVVNAIILDASLSPTAFSESVLTPQRRVNFSGRFDYQLNQSNTLVARYNYGRDTLKNAGVGRFALASRGYDISSSDHTLQLTETAVLSPSLLNETRFQYVLARRALSGDNSAPAVNVQDAFIGGGSQIGLAVNEAVRVELQNFFLWTKGGHTIKTGGRIRSARITDTAPTNFGGTFVFSSLEQYRQVLLGAPNARPAQFTIAAGEPQSRVNRLDYAVFVQDDWRYRPNLTFSFGLRYESQNNVRDKTDLAPRLAFAWAPGAAARPTTVIRGGIGFFYDRFRDELMLAVNRFDGVNQQQYIVNSPDFYPRIPTAAELLAAAPSQVVRRLDDSFKSSYSMKAALSLEKQLPRNTTLSFNYVYERDLHALRGRNINAPLPGTFDPAVPGSGARPFGNVGNIFVFESAARNSDNTLSISVNSRPNRRVSIFGLLGISRETGDELGPYGYPSDPYDLSAEYGRVSNDVRLFTNVSANVNAPWGVALSVLARATTGNRFNIIIGRDINGDGVFSDRPALATDLNKPGVIVTRFGAFDPNPEPGQPVIPRNSGSGPGYFQVNLRAGKTFKFDAPGGANNARPAQSGGSSSSSKAPEKRFSLALHIQATNIFNHTNFGPFVGNLSSPLFGQANSAFNARRIELGARLSF